MVGVAGARVDDGAERAVLEGQQHLGRRALVLGGNGLDRRVRQQREVAAAHAVVGRAQRRVPVDQNVVLLAELDDRLVDPERVQLELVDAFFFFKKKRRKQDGTNKTKE